MEKKWLRCFLSMVLMAAVGWTGGSAAVGAGSVIVVDRVAPAEVQAGDLFEYQINIGNVSGVVLEDVVVSESVSSGFEFDSAAPMPASTSGGQLSWNLGNIDAGASMRIVVKGSAMQEAEVENCGAVRVSYAVGKCSKMRVVRPALKLVKTGPAEVLLCDPIPVEMVITNTGTGAAENVLIKDSFPAGLTTEDGNEAIQAKVGTLGPGESRRVSVMLRADKAGKYDNKAVATADRGLRAEAMHSVVVREPELVLSKTGPAMRYLGRNATYAITVSNRGDGAARDTRLMDIVPSGMSFLSASDGGSLVGGRIVWDVGTLEQGASRNVSVKMRADRIGTMKNMVTAQAYCAEASAEVVTEVKGIPAILLEVIDLEDPIEVGANLTYVIEVTNQGSAIGTNISLVCTLPSEQGYVSSTGPTKAQVNGQTVRFGALPAVEPKAKVQYKLIVKGLKAGDVRFKVELTSDQMTTSAMETEATRIYE